MTKQRKTPSELVVKGIYRYKGRDKPAVYRTIDNLKQRKYSVEDFTPIGLVGSILRDEVLMVVDAPIVYTTRPFGCAPGVSSELRTYAVKVMSENTLGWISVDELDTTFEELTEDDVHQL